MERFEPRGALPSIGATIAGRYRIVGSLDRGDGNHLFAAFDLHEHRPVSLKVLSGEDADESSDDANRLARLNREAQRLASMRHPNIAQLLDHGEDAGRYYLAQEYVEGPRLSEILRSRGRLRLPEFVPIAVDVLRGVGFANAHGVMVRDVGLDAFGLHEEADGQSIVKLIDLRLARLENDADRITRHALVGTAAYLAPEQVVGGPQDVRIDVYAIGVLFYHLLSGRAPLQADNLAALLYKKVHERPLPLREVLPIDHDVPNDLADLVDECMAISCDDRPSTADLVLERVIDVVPSTLLRLPKPRRSKAKPRVATIRRTRTNGPTEPYPALVMEPLDVSPLAALRIDDAIPRLRHEAGETIPDGALHLGPMQRVTLATAALPIDRGSWRRSVMVVIGVVAALAVVGWFGWNEAMDVTAPEVAHPPVVQPSLPTPAVVDARAPVRPTNEPKANAPAPVEPTPSMWRAPDEPRPAAAKVERTPSSRRRSRTQTPARTSVDGPKTVPAEPRLEPAVPAPPDEFGKLRRKGLKGFD